MVDQSPVRGKEKVPVTFRELRKKIYDYKMYLCVCYNMPTRVSYNVDISMYPCTCVCVFRVHGDQALGNGGLGSTEGRTR